MSDFRPEGAEMIWISQAQPWNLHDFLAARRLKNTAVPSAPAVRWKEHFFWWWHSNCENMFFLRSGRRRIGYVRCTPLGAVSIMVEEAYRGRGYGLNLLRHLRWSVTGSLVAYIAPENTTSLALFKEAGYEEALTSPSHYRVLVNYRKQGYTYCS